MGLVFWVVSAAWLHENIRLSGFSPLRWKKCGSSIRWSVFDYLFQRAHSNQTCPVIPVSGSSFMELSLLPEELPERVAWCKFRHFLSFIHYYISCCFITVHCWLRRLYFVFFSEIFTFFSKHSVECWNLCKCTLPWTPAHWGMMLAIKQRMIIPWCWKVYPLKWLLKDDCIAIWKRSWIWKVASMEFAACQKMSKSQHFCCWLFTPYATENLGLVPTVTWFFHSHPIWVPFFFVSEPFILALTFQVSCMTWSIWMQRPMKHSRRCWSISSS